MGLQSERFKGGPAREACLVRDSAGRYGPSTAAAVRRSPTREARATPGGHRRRHSRQMSNSRS
jgi:hypothetical protein